MSVCVDARQCLKAVEDVDDHSEDPPATDLPDPGGRGADGR